MKQAIQKFDTNTLLRWSVATNQGTKICWAETKEQARRKIAAHGLKITSIKPAPSTV